VGPHQQGEVGGDLVVAGAGGVELAAERTNQLGEPALDRHVDVLVVLAELEAAGVELGPDPVQALRDLLELGVVEHTELGEHASVRLRLLDVEGREAPIERDRGVDPPEQRVLVFAEAGHDRESRVGFRAPRPAPCRPDRPGTRSSR
jgi:hypothetical protein